MSGDVVLWRVFRTLVEKLQISQLSTWSQLNLRWSVEGHQVDVMSMPVPLNKFSQGGLNNEDVKNLWLVLRSLINFSLIRND